MEKINLSKAQKLEFYCALWATNSNVTVKGDTIPYTSVNGHMFSFLTKGDEIGLRLPANERQSFLEKYKTKLVEQYGVVQKEYVVVPDELLIKTDEAKSWFNISYNYTSALKPKPATKGKKKE